MCIACSSLVLYLNLSFSFFRPDSRFSFLFLFLYCYKSPFLSLLWRVMKTHCLSLSLSLFFLTLSLPHSLSFYLTRTPSVYFSLLVGGGGTLPVGVRLDKEKKIPSIWLRVPLHRSRKEEGGVECSERKRG